MLRAGCKVIKTFMKGLKIVRKHGWEQEGGYYNQGGSVEISALVGPTWWGPLFYMTFLTFGRPLFQFAVAILAQAMEGILGFGRLGNCAVTATA